MPKIDSAIRLLLLEETAEDAEQLVNQFRNHGVMVRPQHVTQPEQVAEALDKQEVDLVLVAYPDFAAALSRIGEIVDHSARDCAIIAVLEKVDNATVLELARERVANFLLRDEPTHFLFVVQKEIAALRERRQVRRAEVALKESERRSDALLDSSRDPIAFVHEGMHVRANRAYLDMFGFEDIEALEGTSILDLIAPDAAEQFKGLLKKLSKGEKPPERLEIKAKQADGNLFDAVMEFAEATFEGETCQQITFRQQQKGAAPPSDTDLITGLYNRPYFLKALDQAVAEAASGRNDMTLLYIEPDAFRLALETVGIGNADILMADMAELVRKHQSGDDVLARFSDHSLMLLVKGASHDQALKRAHALRKSFEERIFEAGGKSLSLPVSVGVVMMGERNANTDSLLASAAKVLKKAHDEGGNQVCAFDPSAQDKANLAAEQQRLAQVKAAIDQDHFVLFFQPIISLQGAEGEYYEILLRMNGPEGEILPGDFLPVAEKHGLLPAIDRWVVAHVIKTVAEREKAGMPTTFFLKITIPSLEDPALLPWIAHHLKTMRVPGQRLVFEMPESKVTTNLRPVRDFLKGLSQLHCGFAVQQFGSGLNSSQLLKHIDAQYLKIDRSFMAELPKNAENQAKVKEICALAQSHQKMTIAEFVEDAASMSMLFSFGVDFVQGNFLQEPEKVMAYEFNQQ